MSRRSGPLTHVDGLTSGFHQIDAVYSGDANYVPVSDLLIQDVAPATTTVSVTSTPNPAGAGEPVTFDITVTSETGVVPAGAVYLAVDNVFIDAASLENGHATMIWSSLTPGTHTVDAYFEPESADFIGTVSALIFRVGVTVTAGLSQTVVTSVPNPSELNGTVVFTVVSPRSRP